MPLSRHRGATLTNVGVATPEDFGCYTGWMGASFWASPFLYDRVHLSPDGCFRLYAD